MTTNQPDRSKKVDTFEQWFKSMNQLMQEKPVKGFLQTIDDFFRQPFPHSPFRIEVDETETHYFVKVELPGIKREEISLDAIDHALTITVNKEEKLSIQDDTKQTMTQKASRERTSRTIPFSQRINENSIKAAYRDGLLEIRIAKKRGRKVDISIDDENSPAG